MDPVSRREVKRYEEVHRRGQDKLMTVPRLLIGAFKSGSGKTTVTLGLLQAFRDRGLALSSCKCGPDYIDPSFHRAVIGTRSVNLDAFFCPEHTLRYLMQDVSEKTDLCLIEGVMGYYDGLGGVTDQASSYDVAKKTESPVVLIVDAKGISLSLVPLLEGFVHYRKDSRIRGVILNRATASTYKMLKKLIEEEIGGLKVYGYLPPMPDLKLESRHLGLIMPEEVPLLQKKLKTLASQIETTIDLDGLLALSREAPDLRKEEDPCKENKPDEESKREKGKVRIAVARDEAFCFLYQENVDLLEKMGAEIVFFSPLRGSRLPEKMDGLILFGGYPELYLPQLSENRSMLDDIKEAVLQGLPTMAECGGFMYLFDLMEDKEGTPYPMAGVFRGRAYYTGRLTRFGYVTLTQKEGVRGEDGPRGIPAHEFHYYDTTDNGEDYVAEKPLSGRKWPAMHAADTLLAGFPHLYYYACPQVAERFIDACLRFRDEKRR